MEDQNWNESDVEMLDEYLQCDSDWHTHFAEPADISNIHIATDRTIFHSFDNDCDDDSFVGTPQTHGSDGSNQAFVSSPAPSLHLLDPHLSKLLGPIISTWKAFQPVVQGSIHSEKKGMEGTCKGSANYNLPFSAVALGPAPVLSTTTRSALTNHTVQIQNAGGGNTSSPHDPSFPALEVSQPHTMRCEMEGTSGLGACMHNSPVQVCGMALGPSSTSSSTSPPTPDGSDAAFLSTHGRDQQVPLYILERRERNRRLARRARVRKQALYDKLLVVATELYDQNKMLKAIVKSELAGHDAETILSNCHAVETVPECVLEASKKTSKKIENPKFDFVRRFQHAQRAFVITDPTVVDNPIIFASADFLELTGYTSQQVCGRNCRFLQGPQTSLAKVRKIRKAIACDEAVRITLVNYRADDTPFWNNLYIAAVHDAENNVVNYVGLSVQVASPPPGDPEYGIELSHSVKNMN